ncbi:MAG: HTTM domain-containing protein [Planctomycetaceae bacterium]
MRTRGLFQTIAETACEPRDMASLVFFRIACGLILLWEVLRYFLNGWIDSLYLLPQFHFTYLGFGWVRPWPGDWLFLHFLVLGIAAAGLTLGYRSRTSAAVLSVGWGYVLLLEKSAFLNHLYLICLLTFLMIFVPVGQACSWDTRRRPEHRSDFVPAVGLWVLRAQIAIPYVFGALAKLNGDWLHGQPLQMWMSRMTHVRQVVPAFGEPWLALAFSYAGFLLDLFVVPLLLWRRTRVWACIAAVAFHLMNAVVFRIGIFPWFMICATTLFFEPDWPRRVWRRLGFAGERGGVNQSRSHAERGNENDSSLTLRVILAVGVWFAVQFAVPFQHLYYPGDVDWTEEGSRFTWRMMLNDKTSAMGLLAVDRKTQRVSPIDPWRFLNASQLDYLGRDPDMLVQFSQFLAEEIRRTEHREVAIHAHVFCSLNGRRPQLLVDPKIDLSRQTRGWGHQPWTIPLSEPLLDSPWDQPPDRWGKSLEVPDPNLSRRPKD